MLPKRTVVVAAGEKGEDISVEQYKVSVRLQENTLETKYLVG